MRKSFKIVFSFFLFLCFLTACQRKHHTVTRGFYYWKTIYKPTQYELNTLRKLDVRKIYVRLFDVDQDESLKHSTPVAPIRMGAKDTGFEYVPVVFITQKALLGLNDKDINQMAGNICSFSQFLCQQSGINPYELQIDCDWTASSQNKYFALLKALKAHPYMTNKILSCTIRMNQVKYTAYNGIPPADRGLVMCYSMGSLKKTGALNSILNVGEAKDYLKHLDTYPLQLDIALPLFEWCVLFRDGQFKGIMHEVTGDAVKSSNLFKLKDNNLYTCQQDSLWLGYPLKAGDIIRTEKPSYKDVLSIAEYSSQLVKNKDINVIFFACDSITLSKFSTDELEKVYTGYR